MFVRILLLAGLLVILPGLSQTMAQTSDPAGQVKNAENEFREILDNFRQVQKDPPGYEHRLFERVKKINSRTVRITNILIGGFVVLLIVNAAVLFVLLSDSKRQSSLQNFLAGLRIKFNEVNDQLLAQDDEPTADNGNESLSTPEKDTQSDT